MVLRSAKMAPRNFNPVQDAINGLYRKDRNNKDITKRSDVLIILGELLCAHLQFVVHETLNELTAVVC